MASAATASPSPDPAALRLIGRGASAEVFALNGNHALKLLHLGVPDHAARREFAATQVARAAGLPVPTPYEMVRIGDRSGLLMTRLDEARWLRRVRRWPGAVMVTLAEMARQQAAVHRVATPLGALPTAHEVLGARIVDSAASSRAKAAALAALIRLPRGDRLGHGDLHLGNIMTTRHGMILIDWAQAMAGDPAADVARSELVMRFGRYGALLSRRRWPRAARDAAAAWYLLCYRRMTGMSEAAIDAWRLPVAVAWLREGTAAHVPALTDYIEARFGRDSAAARARTPALG